MFYYFILKQNPLHEVLVLKGSVIKTYSTGTLISTERILRGQEHYRTEDPDYYINPSHFKDYWHLREALPFEVRVAIEAAEASDPIVKAIMGDMRSAPVLDRNDIAFIQGVAVLQDKGLLTQEQANSLLSYEEIE